MSSISGFRFDITGASGTQGLLSPKSSWRCYVLPRGGYASQDSTGTLITFDAADVASRFAVNNWIQVALSTDNIRQVSAVGGNSISVSGSNVTVSENDRVFLIGNTQPTVTGGSATYTVPDTLIRKRDDDAADLYTNSMITSNSDGLIQGFGGTNFYDCIIQDGNQANQLGIVDITIGAVEGISTSNPAVFGATVTINAALGVTGWAFFGSTVTMHAALGVTGWATFGSSVTVDGALGVTGHATMGSTLTVDGQLGVTSWATLGSSVTINGALGVTGEVAIGSSLTIEGNITGTTGAGIFNMPAMPRARISIGTNTQQIPDGNSVTEAFFTSEDYDVGGMADLAGDSRYLTIPTGGDGVYLINGLIQVNNSDPVQGTYDFFLKKSGSIITRWKMASSAAAGISWFIVGSSRTMVGVPGTAIEDCIAGNTISVAISQRTGNTVTIGANNYLTAAKLY